jgi:hypothetical protein
MRRRAGLLRAFGHVLMVLQLLLPPALSIADGLLEQNSASPSAVHIEEHSTPKCHLVHSDDCVLCRTLSQLVAPRRSAPTVPASRVLVGSCRIDVHVSAPTSEWFDSSPSRAPPA